MFSELTSLPDGLLDAKTHELKDLLDCPTLIHLEGKKENPLFISTLLHGNETTGFYALQKLLKQYEDRQLPRSISIFIGNVDAAQKNLRRLDGQPDYNRVWPGTQESESAESDMMNNIAHIMSKKKPIASIDIHNNTGTNPHYACVNILNPHALNLARHFSNIAVYFTRPRGVQSSAFSDFCPAIVLECGQSGEEGGIDHALRFLDYALNLASITDGETRPLSLYHTLANVTIPARYSFSTDESTDLRLIRDLEYKNFHELSAGSIFAEINSDMRPDMMIVTNESAEDVTNEFLAFEDGLIRLKKNVTLSMYTTNTRAISQDCLCYFMERIHIV